MKVVLKDDNVRAIMMSMPREGLLGGPATHLPLLRAGIAAHGIDVIPFNFTRRTDSETKFKKLVDRIIDLINVIYLLIRRRPDILHHNSAFDKGTFVRDGILCLFAQLFRTPIFIKIHGSHRNSFGKLKPFQSLMRYCILRLSCGMGVLSLEEMEEFVSRWPIVAGKVFVVKNIVRSEFIDAEVESQDRSMIFFASRFIRDKGVFDILEAVPNIVSSVPDCRFTFVGNGPDVEQFRRRVAELGLSDVVTYKENRTYAELIEMYIKGGIFVFPTHFPEGMPMAMVEAMAVGMLVISSPVRFVRDISIFKENGLLLSEDFGSYSDQIYRLVVRIVKDSSLRTRIGRINKEITLQYTQDRVASEFVSVYRSLLSR